MESITSGAGRGRHDGDSIRGHSLGNLALNPCVTLSQYDLECTNLFFESAGTVRQGTIDNHHVRFTHLTIRLEISILDDGIGLIQCGIAGHITIAILTTRIIC